MRLLRFKKTKTTILGVLVGDNGDRYLTCENASKMIPCGTYDVTWHDSPHFGGKRPHLHNDEVAKSRYILMHEGNSYKDSEGCILVGNGCDLNSCKITDSKKAVAQLCRMCGATLEIKEEL